MYPLAPKWIELIVHVKNFCTIFYRSAQSAKSFHHVCALFLPIALLHVLLFSFVSFHSANVRPIALTHFSHFPSLSRLVPFCPLFHVSLMAVVERNRLQKRKLDEFMFSNDFNPSNLSNTNTNNGSSFLTMKQRRKRERALEHALEHQPHQHQPHQPQIHFGKEKNIKKINKKHTHLKSFKTKQMQNNKTFINNVKHDHNQKHSSYDHDHTKIVKNEVKNQFEDVKRDSKWNVKAKSGKNVKTKHTLTHHQNGLDTGGELEKWYMHHSLQTLKQKIVESKKNTQNNIARTLNDVKEKAEHARRKAQTLLDGVTQNTPDQFVMKIVKNGTLNDKIAAITLSIQESPLHRLELVDRLLKMSEKKGRREATLAIDALKELFISDLLPPDRRLFTLEEQTFLSVLRMNAISNEALVHLLLEEKIKHLYMRYLAILENGTSDALLYVKKARLKTLYDLLVSVPEQERAVLAMIINKFGDPDKKVAARVVYLLQETLKLHPGMKGNIIAEIERFLFRPHLPQKAQYYAIIYLNQLLFSDNESELAYKLIKIYFSLFRVLSERDLSRKLPQHQLQKNSNNNAQSKLSTNGKLSKKKMKRMQEEKKASNFSAKLLSALLTGVNRALPYAHDKLFEDTALRGHIDILFKLSHSENLSCSIQSMMLLWQLLQAEVNLLNGSFENRYYRMLYEKLLDPHLCSSSSKHALFLNLLFRSMKADTNFARLCAFQKRILQEACHQSAPFAAAALYLLCELHKLSTHGALLSAIRTTSVYTHRARDSEIKKDVQFSSGEDSHSTDSHSLSVIDNDIESDNIGKYDARKREPEYANAISEPAWEAALLGVYFHPSVSKWAEDMLTSKSISYGGDPLNDFTTMAFLDRFVFRNPKSVDIAKHGPHIRAHQRKTADASLICESQILRASVDSLPPDQRFFYQYFSERAARQAKKGESKSEELDLDEFADKVMEDAIEKEAKVNDFEVHPGDFDDLFKDTGTEFIDHNDDHESVADESEFDILDDVEDSELESDDAGHDVAEVSDDEDLSDSLSESDNDTVIDDLPSSAKRFKRNGKTTNSEELFASADDFADLLSRDDADSTAAAIDSWQRKRKVTR